MIEFSLIKSAIERFEKVQWVVKPDGQGFVFSDEPDQFFLTFESYQGAQVHFSGNERALSLCRTVAEEFEALVVLI